MQPLATSRIPSLDGLRAISIALVILGHLCGTRGFPLQSKTVMIYSNFGVRVFFVISGYLITRLLMIEHARTGTVSLRDFYVRRAFRIFPAAFAYLAVIVPLNWKAISWGELMAALTYTVNYRAQTCWALGHLWSLAVEEQFYVVWPVALVLAWRRRTLIAALVVAAGPLIRAGFYWAGMTQANGKYFPAVADSLAAGALITLLEPEFRKHLSAIRSKWFLIVPTLTVLIPLTHVSLKFYWSVGLTLMQLGIALSICHFVERRYEFLNGRVVVWIGVLSYSLYLWQEPFLNRAETSWWTAFPQNLLLAMIAASLSHYLVERPFLRMRDRLRGLMPARDILLWACVSKSVHKQNSRTPENPLHTH